MGFSITEFLPRRHEDTKLGSESFGCFCLRGLNSGAKAIALALLLVFAAQKIAAQDIREIREIYKELNATIAVCAQPSDEPCGYYLNSLTINKQNKPWAAVGIYTSAEDFWYRRVDGEEEPEYRLRKINVKTSRSNRTESEEYLTNDQGDLIFYFFRSVTDETNSQEFRFYFAGGRLIDYTEKVSEGEKAFQIWHREDALLVQETFGKLLDLFLKSL